MVMSFTGSNRIRLLLVSFILFCWFINYDTDSDFTFCLFKNITGGACYGCGFLRGLSAAMHFDLVRVYELNPLNLISIPVFLYVFIKAFVTGRI